MAGGSWTVVLVHGAALDHSVWALQARALAQHGWNVAAPDLPGHGRSEDAEGTDSIEGYAGWLERFIVALGASEVALVGHSMGACITLTLAASAPASAASAGSPRQRRDARGQRQSLARHH